MAHDNEQLSHLHQRNPLPQKNTLAQRYVKKRVLLCISGVKIAYNCAQHKVALILLKKAFPIDPDQSSTYTEKGNLYLALQEYEEALQAFDEVLFVCSNDISALLGRATALRFLKNYDQAIETYNRVLQSDSHLIEASVGKGHSYFSSSNSLEALHAYQEAIHAGTQDVACYSNAGDLLTDLGNDKEALNMYEKALCITSHYKPALKGKADVLFKVKNYQAVLSAYQNLHNLNPEEMSIKLELEDILASQSSIQDINTLDEQPTESSIHTEIDSLWSRFYPMDTSRTLQVQLAFLEQFYILLYFFLLWNDEGNSLCR